MINLKRKSGKLFQQNSQNKTASWQNQRQFLWLHPASMQSAYQHLNPSATTDESVPHKDDISDKAFPSHTTKNNASDFSARSTGQKTQSQTAGLTRFYPKPHQNDPTKSTPFSAADGLTTAPNSRQNSQSATDWQASGVKSRSIINFFNKNIGLVLEFDALTPFAERDDYKLSNGFFQLLYASKTFYYAIIGLGMSRRNQAMLPPLAVRTLGQKHDACQPFFLQGKAIRKLRAIVGEDFLFSPRQSKLGLKWFLFNSRTSRKKRQTNRKQHNQQIDHPNPQSPRTL
jgi:hypothetical protein